MSRCTVSGGNSWPRIPLHCSSHEKKRIPISFQGLIMGKVNPRSLTFKGSLSFQSNKRWYVRTKMNPETYFKCIPHNTKQVWSNPRQKEIYGFMGLAPLGGHLGTLGTCSNHLRGSSFIRSEKAEGPVAAGRAVDRRGCQCGTRTPRGSWHSSSGLGKMVSFSRWNLQTCELLFFMC